jgi:hypothetical protein
MGANRLHRTWKLEYFSQLAELLIRHHNAQILLTGSTQEKTLFEEFSAKIPRIFIEKGHIFSLIGSTKMQDLIAVLKRCKLLVSNDTGPIHIAASVGTSTIGIYLSTAYPGETAPYGEGHYVVCPKMECYPCMDEASGFPCGITCRDAITPSTVFKIATKVLTGDSTTEEIHQEEATILKSRFLSNGTLIYEPYDISENKLKQSLFRKNLLRILWDGPLGIPSDFSILSSLPEDEIKRWSLKTKAIFEEVRDAIVFKKHIVNTSDLLRVSSLLIDFFNLSIHSGCAEDIPLTVVKIIQQLTEIQKWAIKNYRSA